MQQLIRPTLRLIIGPAAVAALAAFQLHPFGVAATAAGSFGVFVFSIVVISAWGSLQLTRARRRLRLLRNRTPGRPS